jgi:tRNA-dihydrouridine synthase B
MSKDNKNNKINNKHTLYFPPINKLGNLAFRKLVLYYGADYVFTEMIRIEKLLEHDEVSFRKLNIPKEDLSKTFIQILAENPKNIEKGIDFIVKYLLDKNIIKTSSQIKEINYNMGCPQSSLCKKECGGGIIKNPKLVEKVSRELFKSCKKYNIKPSIKIRIGFDRENINIYQNVKIIKNEGINKIYIHGRCLKDGYNKPATYEEIEKVIIENPDLEIVGNGDVTDLNSYKQLLFTNCCGVLIGRAALENPKIFYNIKNNINKKKELSGEEFKSRLEIIKKYIYFVENEEITLSQIKSNISYLTKGVIGASSFREKINNILNKKELIEFINNL